ncbi:hypothetical protein NDU88_006984 [Pleurodeles waltl]|uniref:Uncharacterized protein n=1 Tax=Pleurodeles waltl TaxID=8319 RepID=A0AAV7UNL0_PLEWA|nr:hypothetical protein NDU88_006984 [Pleurodeles waltl]
MDPRWKQENKFVEHLQGKYKDFLVVNEGSVDSPDTLWEMGKAYMRGIARSYLTGTEHDKRGWVVELEHSIALRDHREPGSLSKSDIRQLEINCRLCLDEARKCCMATTQKVYEWGKNLAKYCTGWPPIKNRVMPRIPGHSGEWVEISHGIPATFAKYCTNLYAGRKCPDMKLSSPLVPELPLSHIST